MTDVVLALDAGGTKLLGGLVTRSGEIVSREQRTTPRANAGCDPGLAELLSLAHSLEQTAERDGHRLVGAGVGIAEYVLDDRLTSTEVFDWDEQPRELLAASAHGPVSVETDVRCAALADVDRRPDHQRGCLIYVSWGTGLSSSVVIDGVCRTGRRGEALALGEWSVDPRVDPTWSGNLEQYASGHGMGRRLERVTGRPSTGADVAAGAAKGDAVATQIRNSAASARAAALASLVHVLDPDVIVLGGGIGVNGDPLPSLVAEALPHLLHRPDPPEVVRSVAGADAGLLGAAVVGWRGVAAPYRV